MAERDADGYLLAPDGSRHWQLGGRVIEKVLNEGTPMARRIPLALEQTPGGQFLALIGDAELDLPTFLGRWVSVEGTIWMQSFQATSIEERPEPSD